MGKMRTPRPIYKDGIRLNFITIKGVIHYETFVYGSNLKPTLVLTGVYENNSDKLIDKTKEMTLIDHKSMGYSHTFWSNKTELPQQTFTKVGRNQ